MIVRMIIAVGVLLLMCAIMAVLARRLHKPLPASGALSVVGEVADIQDKGPGKNAILMMRGRGTDPATGELVAETLATAVIRGEGGFGGQPGQRLRGAALHRRQPAHLGDVGAGDEGLGSGAGQHHHAHVGVGGGIGEGGIQRFQRLAVQCVQLVGAVDGDRADVVLGCDRDDAGHERSPDGTESGR